MLKYFIAIIKIFCAYNLNFTEEFGGYFSAIFGSSEHLHGSNLAGKASDFMD